MTPTELNWLQRKTLGFLSSLGVVKSSAATGAILDLTPGNAVWKNRNYASFTREGYIQNSDVYACINMISGAVKSIRVFPYTLGSDGKPKEQKKGPLVDLLKRPNPQQSWSQFAEGWVTYLMSAGNSYIERAVGTSSKAAPVELWLPRPDRVQIDKGDKQNPVAGFRYIPEALQPSTKIDWPADFIQGRGLVQRLLHTKFFHPLDDWYGLCYHEDTEILTKDRGWQKFGDLGPDDMVATRHPETKNFEWQRPTAHINREYTGPMHHFKSRTVDLLVTPDHRMLISDGTKGAKERVVAAKDVAARPIKSGHVKVPLCSEWTGVEVPDQVFPWVKHNGDWTFRVSGDDYCALMGAYLSEGCLRKIAGIEIYQARQSKGFKLYEELIKRVNGKSGYNGRAFIIPRRSITEHFRQFGKSDQKFIPDVIRNATKRQLEIFWKYYVAGDGCYQEAKRQENSRGENSPDLREEASTVSRTLADHLTEVIQKLGNSADVTWHQGGPSHVVGVPCQAKDHYRIRLRYSKYAAVTSCEAVDYSGSIHCVSVPNGIVYVRSNGKPVWCGNSPIEASARSVDQNNEAQSWNVSMLQNGMRPAGALVFEGNLDDDTRERIEGTMREKHSGPGNVGKTLILEGGKFTYQELSRSAIDMCWLEGQQMATRRICSIFKVPPQLIGDEQAKTYANYGEARKAFYEECVLPLVDFLVTELSHWLAPFFGENLSIGYDRNEIQAIQEDREIVNARAVQQLDSGLITLNEAREMVGQDPIEGGDVLLIPMTVVVTPIDQLGKLAAAKTRQAIQGPPAPAAKPGAPAPPPKKAA